MTSINCSVLETERASNQ